MSLQGLFVGINVIPARWHSAPLLQTILWKQALLTVVRYTSWDDRLYAQGLQRNTCCSAPRKLPATLCGQTYHN